MTLSTVANHVSTVIKMSSREIAKLTGKRHDHVLADCRKMLEALNLQSPDFLGDYKDERGRTYQEFWLDQDLTLTLMTGYSVPLRHKVAKRWRELETGEARFASQSRLNDTLLLVETASRLLRMAPSGTLGMLKKAEKAYGLPEVLDGYAIDSANDGESSEVALSLTSLLKASGIKNSAAGVNKLLEAAGVIEKKKRASSKGGMKEFWSLTEYGLQFGKNATSPANVRETQPLYYEAHFDKLLKTIGL